MINILILEDEYYTRKFIKKIILDNISVSNVYDTSNGKDVIDVMRENDIHIALLDIELKGEKLNGLEIARLVHDISPKTKIVFITGYSRYAVSAFDVHPYDYILKPVNIKKFVETIVKLINKIENDKLGLKTSIDKLIVKNKSEMFFVPVEDILFIEKSGRNTVIHDKRNFYYTQENLSELEEKLGSKFLRVHRSCIVNKDKISRVKNVGNRVYQIEFLDTDKVAQMSRNGFKKLKGELKSHVV